jgi:hypothetical protein
VFILGKLSCMVIYKWLRASRLVTDIVTIKSKAMMKDFVEAIDNLVSCKSISLVLKYFSLEFYEKKMNSIWFYIV